MNSTVRQFPARLAALTEVLAHIAAVCDRSGMTKIEQMRVELAVEELFTNTVRHGYGRDSDQPVWIATETRDGSLCVTYQDAATPYNPLNRPAITIPPPLGGLGVTLVENFADTRYRYEDGRNTLILTFPPTPA